MLWNKSNASRWALAACLVTALAPSAPALGQEDVVKLAPPAPEYKLGRFKYQAPQIDGWRQIANNTNSLSLIYAEQKGETQIDTLFGVTLEVHEIPAEARANIASAATLAELSRQQLAEQRKADLVAQSPIEAVPSVENIFTYRLLVHAPVKDMPDSYEVYYVAMAPDKSQYVVIQCITKDQQYGDSIYFNQFYGTLASLKYDPDAAKPAGQAATPDVKDSAPAAGSTPPAAPPAGH